MNILGVWDGHDAGAALLVDGRLVAAVNEERLSRRKLEVRFPARAIAACLAIGALPPDAVQLVAACTSDVAKALGRVFPSTKEAYYQVRRRKARPGHLAGLTRFAKYRITEWPPNWASRAVSRWALRRELATLGITTAPLRIYDHHACHAAAAAFASGLPSAVIVTLDGLGDGLSATVSHFREDRLERVAATPAGASPGIFFEQVTNLLNMRELEDEGKVMALADYAAPVADADNPLLQLLSVRDLRFVTAQPARRLKTALERVLWQVPNEQFAFMAQRALAMACVELVAKAVDVTGERRVALAGGIASNVKMNALVRQLPNVDEVYVFPHMGDGGLSAGAAVLARAEAGDPKVPLFPQSLGLGPEYDDAAVERAFAARNVSYRRCDGIGDAVAELLVAEHVVLWVQGRMEYGPRALGHRSVLARPDRPRLRDRLNRLLKRRAWYQPFCPSMLDSEARRLLADFTGRPNRDMTMAYQVAEAHREAMAGVINVDGSCRPQMVADDATGPFPALLHAIKARIGVGAVLNTSLNLHGSPLACSPDEALEVFTASGADAIAMGPFLATRAEQP